MAAEPLDDFFSDGPATLIRPERTEDKVPRDTYSKPRILPPGMKMPTSESARAKVLRSYARPSDYAGLLEDKYKLERWSERMAIDGMMGSRALRAQWVTAGAENLPDGTKDRRVIEERDRIVKEAKKMARTDDKSSEGTALHAVTERHDMGILESIPDGYEEDLSEWARLTKDFTVLDVECFVVEDVHKCAGTFDRLVSYWEKCGICGCSNYILDLKSGHGNKILYEGLKIAAQLALYAHGQYYNPTTGERTPLPDVCLHRAIVVDLPFGTHQGNNRWVNIAQGWNEAVRLSTAVREIRRFSGWWLPFSPMADILPLIQAAGDREMLTLLWRQYANIWTEDHTKAASARMEELG